MAFAHSFDNQLCYDTKPETIDFFSQEETVDPRVQVELERLNTATEAINKLEIELDDARSSFRQLLKQSSNQVNQLAKKLGTCVEKARPYYEARMQAKQLQTQAQKAALQYERASSAHSAAKEMVYLAEEGLKKEGRCFDPAWQEMLNHATHRVNEAESERVLSHCQHQKTSLAYNESEKIVQNLHRELKKTIVKSRPYFELKAQFNQLLEEQRKKVHHQEENILKMKSNYADALHNLEEISDEIHKKRAEIKEDSSFVLSDCRETFSKLKCNNKLPKELTLENKCQFPEIESKSERKNTANGSLQDLVISIEKERNCMDNYQVSNICHDSFSNQSEQSSISNNWHTFQKQKSNEIEVKEFFNNDLDVPKYKSLVSDFNLLRIQQEEFSDSESLASNDTIDTLDDNQIECLMLEKELSLKNTELESDSSYIDIEQKL